MRLILNADDFGMNSKVNLAIQRLAEQGGLDSISLMATGSAFEEAAKWLEHHPFSVGVHLVVQQAGSQRQVLAQWSQQVEKILEKGIFPDHLDGHQHQHLSYLPALKVLQQRFGIHCLRVPGKPKQWRTNAHRIQLRYLPPFSRTPLACVSPGWLLQHPELKSKGGILEIMLHPGNPYDQERCLEQALLETPWWQGWDRCGWSSV